MKTIKILFLFVGMLMSSAVSAQAKGEAWFYAIDNTNKIVYITELEQITVPDNLNNHEAWRNGFVDQMSWQELSPGSYVISFNWMKSNHEKWYASDVESRNNKIEAFKKKYTLRWIKMPTPKNPTRKPSGVSGQ
ncbi:hypothetical protein [Flavobacterium sp.]|uniref:hypothetical protein n=1 Tax=Flavobacterium sp. TaxID=239 RepID=UPI003B9A1D73